MTTLAKNLKLLLCTSKNYWLRKRRASKGARFINLHTTNYETAKMMADTENVNQELKEDLTELSCVL